MRVQIKCGVKSNSGGLCSGAAIHAASSFSQRGSDDCASSLCQPGVCNFAPVGVTLAQSWEFYDMGHCRTTAACDARRELTGLILANTSGFFFDACPEKTAANPRRKEERRRRQTLRRRRQFRHQTGRVSHARLCLSHPRRTTTAVAACSAGGGGPAGHSCRARMHCSTRGDTFTVTTADAFRCQRDCRRQLSRQHVSRRADREGAATAVPACRVIRTALPGSLRPPQWGADPSGRRSAARATQDNEGAPRCALRLAVSGRLWKMPVRYGMENAAHLLPLAPSGSVWD